MSVLLTCTDGEPDIINMTGNTVYG